MYSHCKGKINRSNTFIPYESFHYFTFPPLHHFGISPFCHFDVLPFYQYKHTIIFVTYFCLQYHLPHVNQFSLFISSSSYREILSLLVTRSLLNIKSIPLISTIFFYPPAKYHTYDPLVSYRKQIFFLSNITQVAPIVLYMNPGIQ